MDWQKLDLAKASVLKREVDVALQRLYDTNPELNKAKLCSSVQYRIQELENFCSKNSDDDRTILFEKERLRLRKALQSQTAATKDGKSVNTSENRSVSPAAISTTSGNRLSSASKLPVSTNQVPATSGMGNSGQASIHSTRTMPSQRMPSTPTAATTAANTSFNASSVTATPQNRSISGNQSTAHTLLSGSLGLPPSHSAPIYAWEESNERALRVPIEIANTVFLPTKQIGFYNRQDPHTGGFDTTPLPEKYLDFQIILSAEELITLAARKKTMTSRIGQSPRVVKPTLHSSTPYVDPRRIQKDLLRPVNPDKWLSSEGLRPYKHMDKI